MTSRVYLVDDEEPIRRSCQLMLRVMGYDVQTFENGLRFLEEVTGLEPGTLILDMRMPVVDGLQVLRALEQRAASHSVIAMSGHGDVGVAISAFRKSAVAFLEKPFAKSALEEALQIARWKLENAVEYESYLEKMRSRHDELDDSERRFLAGLAQGRTTEAIAQELGLASQGVEVLRAHLFSRLEIESMADALRFAFAAGLGTSPVPMG